MQVLKQHKIITVVSLLIVIILAVSTVVLVQNLPPQPSPTPPPHSSTTPTPSPIPTPTQNSPTPTTTASATPTFNPQPTPIPSVFPTEVLQYNNQNMTPISIYTQILIAHPDVAIAGAQFIDKLTYQLVITGLVNNPVNYTYDEVVNNFDSTIDVATLPCVEGWSVTFLWQGIPIKELLQQAGGVSPDANTLIFVASDGYTTSLPLSFVEQDNIMIAYKINNITLTPQTGWPFFLVAKNQYGYKWAEWVTEINVSNDSNYRGYWESRGYPINATVRDPNLTQPLINNPTVILPAATITIASIALAATILVSWREIKKKQKPKTTKNASQATNQPNS